MISQLSANSLTPLFTAHFPSPKAPPPEENTPYELLKAAVTHSSISKFAITGSMLGWFSGQSWEMGLAGATAGAVKDLVPLLFNKLPDDIKELATQTANIGLTTLGTYALYHAIPNSWVKGIFNCIPISIRRFPETLKDIANSPISTPNTPRTLEAVVKEALKFISPLVTVSVPLIKGSLAGIGFGNFRKFMVSASASYLGFESLKAVGEHRLVRPLTTIVKEFANDRAQFMDRLLHVALAISAIPVSSYLHANPIQPLDLTPPDLSLPLATRAVALFTYWGGHAVNTILSKETYIRAFVVTTFFAAHVGVNYYKPPEPAKESDEVKKVTLDDIYKLLLQMMEGDPTVKVQTPIITNRSDALQAAIQPLREKLDRAVKEGHIENQTKHRDAILDILIAEIGALNRMLVDNGGVKSQLLISFLLSEVIDLYVEELDYKKNDKAHKNLREGANVQQENAKRTTLRTNINVEIRDHLVMKFNTLTSLSALLVTEIAVAQKKGNTEKATSLTQLDALVNQVRANTHNTIQSL